MPPENEEPSLHYGFISADGIEWNPVGHIDEFAVTDTDDEMSAWADRLVELQNGQVGTITFRIPWWQDNRKLFMDLFGCSASWFSGNIRTRYTVPMLRRNGKSHMKIGERCKKK